MNRRMEAQAGKKLKNNLSSKGWRQGVTQVIQLLPSKHEALSSNTGTTKKKR
jgi:hypothetical protein